MAILRCQEVRFAYTPERSVLDGVTLSFEAGKLVGIVGPNGAGKSTLLRVLGGMLRPKGGRVELEGKAVAAMRRGDIAKRVGFLPQMVAATFSFTVREVVALGRYPHLGAFGFLSAKDLDAVERALAETGSDELAGRRFSELSGGERQRVLVASVMAQEPRVMLLDEPLSALDLHHQVLILELLVRWTRQGGLAVAVTHDLNLAGQFCDAMVLLDRGTVAREGRCEEVIDQRLLEEVYRTALAVEPNPVTGKPMVVLLGSDPATAGGGAR